MRTNSLAGRLARTFRRPRVGAAAAVFAGLLFLGLPVRAQEEPDEGITPQGTLEELRKRAGTRVTFTVLKMIDSQVVNGISGYVTWDGQYFQKVAVVEAGDLRAIVIPAATILRTGMTLSMNVQFLGNFSAPTRLGLPAQVAVYREAPYKDKLLYMAAYEEALRREIGLIQRPGSLKRYLVSWDRVGEITPDKASRGYPNPMDPQSAYFFTQLPEMSFEVVDSAFVDGNYRVRLVNPESGARAVLNLPWNSRESLRGAAKGTRVNAGGWVEAIRVGPGGVERGELFLNQNDFPDFLEGKVRTIG